MQQEDLVEQRGESKDEDESRARSLVARRVVDFALLVLAGATVCCTESKGQGQSVVGRRGQGWLGYRAQGRKGRRPGASTIVSRVGTLNKRLGTD